MPARRHAWPRAARRRALPPADRRPPPYRSCAQALAGAEPAPCGQDVVDGGGEGMLGGQAIVGDRTASRWPVPAGRPAHRRCGPTRARNPRRAGTAAPRPGSAPGAASQLAGTRARGHLPDQHVVRHRMKTVPGDEGGAALFQRRRGLAGTGPTPVPEGVDRVLHGLARHVGISVSARRSVMSRLPACRAVSRRGRGRGVAGTGRGWSGSPGPPREINVQRSLKILLVFRSQT